MAEIDPHPVPLEPVPKGGLLGNWIWVLLAFNVLGLLWHAARINSPPDVRNMMDIVVNLGLCGLVVAGAFYVLNQFPYRIVDLLAMVFALAANAAFTMRIRPDLVLLGLEFNPETDWPATLQILLLTGSLLILGAAQGLRYCQRLKLERNNERMAAVWSGMFMIPALCGVLIFPILYVKCLAAERFVGAASQEERHEYALRFLIWWAVCGVVSARNLLLSMRSMALESSVTVGTSQGTAPTQAEKSGK